MEFVSDEKISVREFERRCGLSNGYVKGIRHSILPDKMRDISLQFSRLNTTWLMTGDGNMLNNTEQVMVQENSVMLLPIYAQGGSLNDFTISVNKKDCERIVSPIKDADWGIEIAGDSMAPEFPSGSRVLIKKINERAFIEWGKVHVLDTCNGVIVKELRKSDEPNKVTCCSVNPNPKYAPFDVDMSDIYGIYRVMMCLSIK